MDAGRGRVGWAAIAVAVCLAPALSGCVGLKSSGSLEQRDGIGDKPIEFTACASGPGCDLGFSGAPAQNGPGQVLVGALVPRDTTLPDTLTSSVPFAESPSYAAELQRLAPAPPGATWRGFISPTLTYDTASTLQSFTVTLLYRLRRGADGSPYVGPFAARFAVGGRMVTATAPASRPVACGPSLRALHDDDPAAATDAWNICEDTGGSSFESTLRDLGILTGPTVSAAPGELATLPFAVKYVGAPTSQLTFRLSAASTLPGALFAVTPAAIVPLPGVGTTTTRVGVGVPANARPGSYDVTLTAVINGEVRTSTGTLRVVPAPAGGAAGPGGPAERLRLTTVLPRRMSARTARRRGVVVLLGATKGGVARVQLFQGRGKAPKAARRVRLKVPGPARVVLGGGRLKAGPYRVVVLADGLRFVRRAVLVR